MTQEKLHAKIENIEELGERSFRVTSRQLWVVIGVVISIFIFGIGATWGMANFFNGFSNGQKELKNMVMVVIKNQRTDSLDIVTIKYDAKNTLDTAKAAKQIATSAKSELAKIVSSGWYELHYKTPGGKTTAVLTTN